MKETLAPLEPYAHALGALEWWHWTGIWSLMLGLLMGSEYITARYTRWKRRFCQRLFEPLHWILAFGPFVILFKLAWYVEDGEPGGHLWFVLGIVGFFGTVIALERTHDFIWKTTRAASGGSLSRTSKSAD